LKSSPAAFFIYSKLKENKENDMKFCYFSCFGLYSFRPMSMAALPAQAVADACLAVWYDYGKYFFKAIQKNEHKKRKPALCNLFLQHVFDQQQHFIAKSKFCTTTKL
jgi:hypothetical protein